MKRKAERNKTIDFGPEEGSEYVGRCIREEELDKLSAGGDEAFAEALRNQFLLGDAFSVLDRLPRGFADLLIADPPYNLRKNYHGNVFDRQSAEEYRAFTVSWLEKTLPILKDNASVYVCCDWESGMVIGEVLSRYLRVRNRITWQREKGRGAKTNWKNGMEDIWFATVGKEYTFHLEDVMVRKRVMAPYREEGRPKDWEETRDGNFRNTCPSNFWDDISIPYWSMPENTAHPTQKPEKLIAKLILASSSRGDLVLDPFAGSGTTAVVAKKLGRDYLAIEQNDLYGAWAQKRLETAESGGRIQGYADGVFWERNSHALQKKASGERQSRQKK